MLVIGTQGALAILHQDRKEEPVVMPNIPLTPNTKIIASCMYPQIDYQNILNLRDATVILNQ